MAKRSQTSSDDFLKLLNDEEADSSSMWSHSRNTTERQLVSPFQKKLESNLGQSKDPDILETRNRPVINPEQSRNKPVTDQPETRNKPVMETRNNKTANNRTRNKPVTIPVTNPEQRRNKPVTVFSFSSATQFQREILHCIYRQMNNSIDKETPPMSLSYFGSCLGKLSAKEFESLRIVTLRLEKMGLLTRPKIKNGRGGWTQYSLPQPVYSEIRELETRNEPVINPEQTRSKPVTIPVTDAPSSSSSLYNNKTTTTTDPAWSELDLSPLDGLIGFTRSHVEQIIRRNVLTPEQVQVSIYAFAFDLEENGKGKAINSPLNYFMGVLNKGVYAPSENYESPKDRANRRYSEWKKRESEKNAILEKENMEFAFADWVKELTQEAREQVVPESQFAKAGSPGYEAMLKEHFCKNVWPSEKERIVNSVPNQENLG